MDQETIQILTSIGAARIGGAPANIDIAALPHAALSYASGGEDLALRRYFKKRIMGRQPGLYVDIGCAAPASLSNTFLFYCLGWRGVCIDPNPEAAEYWRAMRPEDTYIHAAIGTANEALRFYRHKMDPGRSHIGAAAASNEFDAGVPVRVLPLAPILERYVGPKSIQLMSIDVEGAELGVLQSNDWTKYRPEIVIIECHGFDMLAPLSSETISYLCEQGYRLDAKIGENIILQAG